MKYDVAVIGSGFGGLACAHILGRQGMRVLVLEQAALVGGCTLAYKRRGVELDTGFHYLGGLAPGQSLHCAFSELNLMHLPWVKMDERFERITAEGKTYCFAQGFDTFVRTLAADFPEDKAGLERLAALLQQTACASAHDECFMEQSQTSAWEYLCATIHNPLLREILCVPASIKGEMCKDSLPLFNYLHINSGCIESAWRLRGSGNLIVDSLRTDIERFGGTVLTKARVTELTLSDGRITQAVCADGQRYEADLFISDIHPAQTMNMVNGRVGIFARRLNSLQNTAGTLTVSVLLKPHTLRYFNWNHYLMEGDKRMLVNCRLPEDGSDYAQVLDLLIPLSANDIPRDANYEANKQAMARRVVNWAAQAIPGLHEMIENTYVSTPQTYARYTLTPDGSSFGVRKDWRSPLTTFLSPRTPIANLWLTGQSLTVHGIQGVAMTAFNTCNHITKQYKQ